MAANKFATMLHRNTNKITLILIYAVLEWILIVLLLLNSLFSYLIIKFADYFGLKPPCPWCSRVDHIFEPEKRKNSPTDLLCEFHSSEISKLGYCSNHRKLAESRDMCEDCSSSRPNFNGLSKDFGLFPWMKQIGMIENDAQKVFENNGDLSCRCSCCGLSFERKSYSPCIVIKPPSSWDVLDYPQKGKLITEADDEDEIEKSDNSDRSRSDCFEGEGEGEGEDEDEHEHEHGFEENSENLMVSDEFNGGFDEREDDEPDVGGYSVSVPNSGLREFEEEEEEEEEDDKVGGVALESEKEAIIIEKEENSHIVMEDDDPSSSVEIEILPQHLEFFVGFDGFRLIPVEFDSQTQENHSKSIDYKEEEAHDQDYQLFEVEPRVRVESVISRSFSLGEREEHKFAVLESMEIEENETSLIFHPKECDVDVDVDVDVVREVYEQLYVTQAMAADQEQKEMDSDNLQVCAVSEEVSEMPIGEMDLEVSIGTEIPDLDPTDDILTQDVSNSNQCIHDEPSTSSANLHANDDHCFHRTNEETIECKTIPVEITEKSINNNFSLCSELNEIEEEKVPDTPTSIDSPNHLQRKFLSLERRESSTEESIDGSVISEFEGGDGTLTVDRLKTTLRSERKALNALYAELEEERSASAVAASQTMAMINRLQEEKAAMQMEALQYQRMMEEQSEFDQEALQLLNELMVKREKENQELERELESYRKRLSDYEMREKIRMLRKSGNYSTSCSNTEDSDGVSVDLNQEAKEEESFYTHQENGNHAINTPIDAVLDFEEERLSILEQLKSLEEKLFTLSDEEEENFQQMNGKHLEENSHFEGELNGLPNGFSKEMNGKHYEEKRILGPKGKRLLPLFDAISEEHENGLPNGRENGIESENYNKVVIEEEVDHLYERLQALEEDREFLKHCISSLKKGDKGIDLLQEILQHLRDLRNVETRVRNLGENAIV